MSWLYFAFVQLVSLLATVVGWIVLIPFCMAKAWEPAASKFDPSRRIDRWIWPPVNWIYGNPEDGVSGQQARIWLDATTQGPYLPDAGPRWRAYRWSALRNSADNLKYLFSWKNGPFVSKTLQAGWKMENGYNVPVISFK